MVNVALALTLRSVDIDGRRQIRGAFRVMANIIEAFWSEQNDLVDATYGGFYGVGVLRHGFGREHDSATEAKCSSSRPS
jgi:hypothetical protein